MDSQVSKSRVYPRVCGGTPSGSVARWNSRGLSPRVRGNPAGFLSDFLPCRSIPACAGEPECNTVRNNILRVYPRVCGGTRLRGRHQPDAVGLSPRVRGNPNKYWDAVVPIWSIPACAGEPFPARLDVADAPVYPRVCGGTSEVG